MATVVQENFFSSPESEAAERSGSFIDNMKLPVHRWFRYSAGFSAQWIEAEILAENLRVKAPRVFDPFAGSGTTLICAEQGGVESFGAEAHPFVIRVARAKLGYSEDPSEFLNRTRRVVSKAQELSSAATVKFPPLIEKCYSPAALKSLSGLRVAVAEQADGSATSELVWLALVGILRSVSHVGTAPWQYVLPNKTKRKSVEPIEAFRAMAVMMASDMKAMKRDGPRATLLPADARDCEGVPDKYASLVITSPPYANNYDYADATRLEMTFLGDIDGWGDLQQSVRKYLVRSCTQHVPERTINLPAVLDAAELAPIRDELRAVCAQLAEIRLTKGGKKNYHLMAACYFGDMARVWTALRRVCADDARVCFVIGDSAPYGVYLPIVEWMGKLAISAGFSRWSFEKLRDRNIKWKNRKHRVPLLEGRLWVES